MKQTIAQQLGITKFPFEIKNNNGKIIYFEDIDGFWVKSEYDSNDNRIYQQDSNRDWVKLTYDSNNNEIYSEDSDGMVTDNRPKKKTVVIEIKIVN